MRNAIVPTATLLIVLLNGCGADFIGENDSGPFDTTGTAEVTDFDVIEDTTQDAATDARPETGLTDTTDNDEGSADAWSDNGQDISEDVTDDTDTSDVPGTDTNPEFLEERQGWAWTVSPADVDPTEVTYRHLESRAGKLTGKYAEVWNCLRQEGGMTEKISWGGEYYDVALCLYAQTVVPGEDGSYLHVEVPQSARDGNDPFAEGHTYYSINKVHDFFHDTFGHTANDRSLFAVVNIGFQIEGGPAWMPMDNAAFLPDASYGFMGFNMHEGEMLAFGQGRRVDYCSDSAVVFHEYTHFVVTGDRLSLNTGDSQGFNADPIAINEGFADYFPSTILDIPLLGEYALGDSARDLSESRRCPDHYVGESHYDGRIWSSTLWEIRQAIGAEFADQLAYMTLIECEMTTTFAMAAAIYMDACEQLAPEHLDTVRSIMESHNIVGCSRTLEYGTDIAAKTYYVPGRMDSYAYEFQSSVVSPFQYKITVPEGKTGFIAYFRAEDMYGYDENPETRLMVRRGDEPITWTYSDRPIANADKSFDGERITYEDVAFTIAGDCVTPGTYHIQLINKAGYSIVSKLNNVAFFDDLENLTWDGCGPADEGVVEYVDDIVEPDDDVIESDVESDVTDPDTV